MGFEILIIEIVATQNGRVSVEFSYIYTLIVIQSKFNQFLDSNTLNNRID